MAYWLEEEEVKDVGVLVDKEWYEEVRRGVEDRVCDED